MKNELPDLRVYLNANSAYSATQFSLGWAKFIGGNFLPHFLRDIEQASPQQFFYGIAKLQFLCSNVVVVLA